MALPLSTEQTTEYNNVVTTPPTAPLGDIINELYAGGQYGPTGANVDIFVDSATGSDATGNGLSFATAYQTIERAVSDVADTDIPFTRFVTIRCRGSFGDTVRVVVSKNINAAVDPATFTVLGGLLIQGEPNTLNDTRALVGAAAGAAPVTADLTLTSALSGAVVAGKTFVEQIMLGRKIYYPVLSAVGAVVTVVGGAFFFTPGESLRVIDVGGVAGATLKNAAINLNGTIELAGFHLTAGALNSAFTTSVPIPSGSFNGPFVGALCVDDNPLVPLFLYVSVTGCHWQTSVPLIQGAFVDNANVSGAAAFAFELNAVMQYMRHTVATATKISVRQGLATIYGEQSFAGAGTAVKTSQGAGTLNAFNASHVGAGLTKLFEVTSGGKIIFDSAAPDGTVAGVAVTLREAAQSVGLEAAAVAGGLASTPGGSDVTVGAGATIAFAALPATDATELVRAT